MLGKNPFRTFLYLVLTIVVLKLCYNLGHSFATRRLKSATEQPGTATQTNRQGQALRGVILEPADTVTQAQKTAPAQ
jgi:hypothetical protein